MNNKKPGRRPIGFKPEGDTCKHSFLTEQERLKILESIKGGAGRIMACEVTAIGYDRFCRTCRDDPDFKTDVDTADFFKEEIALAVIYNGVSQGGSEKSAEVYLRIKAQTRTATAAAVEARKSRKLRERELELNHGGKRDESRPDLSKLSPEDLALYLSLLEKLGVPFDPPADEVVIDVDGGVVDAEPLPD